MSGLPWERRGELGLGPAALATLRLVLFAPSDAFRQMRPTGGWTDPLSFAVVFVTLGVWFGLLWQMLARSLVAWRLPGAAAEAAAANVAAVWAAALAPFWVVVLTVLGAAVTHALLLLFGGATRPFETTLRVAAFAGAANLLQALPLCGALVAPVWGTVVYVIGLREAQQVPTARAAAAVLVPWVLSCLCATAILLLVVGMAGLVAAPP